MGSRNRENFVALHSDVPGDEERVRAILAGWGLEENAIYRLLTEGRPGQSALQKADARGDDFTAPQGGATANTRGGFASH